MMMHSNARRGSALLLSLVVVLLTAGVGGAFLMATLTNSKSQQQVMEADEALTMCDAGMERARHALGVYTGKKTWAVNDILTYCAGSYQLIDGAANPKNAPQIRSILNDYKIAKDSAFFKAYAAQVWSKDAIGVNVTTPGAPQYAIKPVSGDAQANNVIFGWPIPFHRGAIYIHVRNNATEASPYIDTDNQIILTVTATLPSGIQRQIEGVLSAPTTSQKVNVNGLAAVVSLDEVSTLGNITIDGRDYDYAGANVLGPGVLGILSGGGIAIGGASAIGGTGNAPPKSGASTGSISPDAKFTGGYPAGPDEASGLAPGTLATLAKTNGTYFSSESAFNAMLSANGGKMPDHAVVYCDFTPSGGSFDIGTGNSKSSMLIVHTDGGTGAIKNLHGTFTGAIFADSIIHVNAGTKLTGMVQLFSPVASDAGNVFGNGNSTINFSSAALSDLVFQAASPSSPFQMSSYRRTY